MLPPSVRLFTLGDVVLQGAPSESPGYLFNGRVIVNIRAPTAVKLLKVVFQTEQCNDTLYVVPTENNDSDEYSSSSNSNNTSSNTAIWSKGSYEFFFQIVLPGNLCETMYTEHKRVSYEVRAVLQTGNTLSGAQHTTVQPIAVKRVPYNGAVWEALANDMVHVTAVWRDSIEMCALGCSRVQRDDQPLRVKGVVRALEKGFKLTKVGFILEERTRSRIPGRTAGIKCTSSVVACTYLRPKTSKVEHKGWFGDIIVDQRDFEMVLNIPKAYGKIQYDVKHGPVTVSHRLAFVIAVVDKFGRGTSLRLFTPLHIMPHDCADSGEELPSYISSFADRVLLRSMQHQAQYQYQQQDGLQFMLSPAPSVPQPSPISLLSMTPSYMVEEFPIAYSDVYPTTESIDNDGDSAVATDTDSADCVQLSDGEASASLGNGLGGQVMQMASAAAMVQIVSQE
ncbi:hypothetical protein GGI25_004040 [Coemansia spiralis]|uniref:Arrestin C-terminal-like domain-containing protein n=1 Tax=Coemansia spiralis TaxID=417178 RepID=A0A9W8G691_9FUNG|nr:hypothetical protein GGI25_004040 [Coemansia spiralis]